MTNATKLTGLWKKEDKSGRTYFTGSFSPTARMVIFPNGYKGKETDPDYYVYIVPAEPRAVEQTGAPLEATSETPQSATPAPRRRTA